MERFGNIEIKVLGNKGNLELSPDNYDVKEIVAMLQNIEDLLYPTNKKDRPIITYNIQEGSVRHIFKTSIQAIIGFSAILSQIQKSNSIDFLELRTAQAIENIQQFSYQEFQADASCWCVYWNANLMLKDFNTYLVEKIRADMAGVKLE